MKKSIVAARLRNPEVLDGSNQEIIVVPPITPGLSTTADLLSSNESIGVVRNDLTKEQVHQLYPGASVKQTGFMGNMDLVADGTSLSSRAVQFMSPGQPTPISTQQIFYMYNIGQGSNLNTAYISAYLKFMPGFDFNYGGKLPIGLVGHGPSSWIPWGGTNPKDGNGFSVRFMWRGPNYYNVDYPCLEMYTYYMKGAGKYGSEFRLGPTDSTPIQIQTGRWYHLGLGVNLGTGTNDGWIKGYLDGQLIRAINGLQFKNYYSQHFINATPMWFFSGGNTQAWVPAINSYIRVYGWRIGSSPSRAGLPNG
jgi:hypothetical protein